MFERFTDRARAALVEAQAESVEGQHGFLGTEHLLIGLLRVGEGVAYDVLTQKGVALETVRPKVYARLAEFVDPNPVPPEQALATIGIDLNSVREQVEATFGSGALREPWRTPPFTPKAKSALEHGLKRALLIRQRFIGTEHVLLGVLEMRDGLACGALADLGVDLDELDAAVVAAAAPDEARVSAAWETVIEFRRAVAKLSEEQQRQVQPVLRELASRHGEVIGEEQREAARLARETAERLEQAAAAAREALRERGIDV